MTLWSPSLGWSPMFDGVPDQEPVWDDGGEGWGDLRHAIIGDLRAGCRLTLYPFMGDGTHAWQRAGAGGSWLAIDDGIGDAAMHSVAANY